MSTYLTTVSVDLVTVRCWCGTPHAIPQTLYRQANENPRFAVYCPLGHSWVRGDTAYKELERKLTLAQDRIAIVENDREYERKQKIALKGQLTKERNRISKGVCPCCKRHFIRLEMHMATQHPDFAGVSNA